MRAEAQALALVAAGGAAGTGLRALLTSWWPATGQLPTTTLLVNLCGALLLGLLHGWLDDRERRYLRGRADSPGGGRVADEHRAGPGLQAREAAGAAQAGAPRPRPAAAPSGSVLRLLLGTGLLGGLTTHSTFSLEAQRLLERAPALGATYLLGSFAGGLLLAAVGLRAGSGLAAAGRQEAA